MLRRFKHWRYERQQRKIAEGLLEIYLFCCTMHGRYMVSYILARDDEEHFMDPLIRHLYEFFLNFANIQEIAEMN